MKNSLGAHIQFLEHELQELTDRMTYPNLSPDGRARLEARIKFATEAINNYRRAFHLENILRETQDVSPLDSPN